MVGGAIHSQAAIKRIAVVHEWLITFAGSESVVEQILTLYPDADLYSLVDFLPEADRGALLGKRAYTSFIQYLPCARSKYRSYLPFMPYAVERFDLSKYDLILSSSHAVAKGVRKRSGQLHICYCHTPMRYAWDLKEQYLREARLDKGIRGYVARSILDRLQAWDARTAEGVDYFIANSRYIADRIKRAYKRESTVIYPPVDVERFGLCTAKDDYYLAASRIVPYKRINLIVEAFAHMPDRQLVVIGDGPGFNEIKSKASSNIVLLGYQSQDVLIKYLQRAKAFIFAAEEDFGIMPVESQACGTPVIAFGRGGALETVIEGETGIFFFEQTSADIQTAVDKFEQMDRKFSPMLLRNNAERFGRKRFQREYKSFVEKAVTNRNFRD
jgi:glycosyltransferase involved in cell wall biosynthesis